MLSGLGSLGQHVSNSSHADDHGHTEITIAPDAHNIRRNYILLCQMFVPKLTCSGFRLGFRSGARSQVRGNFNIKQYPTDDPGIQLRLCHRKPSSPSKSMAAAITAIMKGVSVICLTLSENVINYASRIPATK